MSCVRVCVLLVTLQIQKYEIPLSIKTANYHYFDCKTVGANPGLGTTRSLYSCAVNIYVWLNKQYVQCLFTAIPMTRREPANRVTAAWCLLLNAKCQERKIKPSLTRPVALALPNLRETLHPAVRLCTGGVYKTQPAHLG